MDKFSKSLIKQLRKVRSFPTNTCPYSRHAQMIGENLVREKPYPMLEEEPEHCGGSILATVLALYEARSEIAILKVRAQKLGCSSAVEQDAVNVLVAGSNPAVPATLPPSPIEIAGAADE